MANHIAPDIMDVVGCWGDGACGHQHTRNCCAAAIYYFVGENFTGRGQPAPEGTQAIIDELKGDMSDDASEESDAEAWLNDHAPFDGCFWGWQDGNFGLWITEDED